MKIEAINSLSNTVGCQPIRQVEFSKRQVPNNKEKENNDNKDSFSSETKILEQKYNTACHLAAYYKTKYESLIKNGNCIA